MLSSYLYFEIQRPYLCFEHVHAFMTFFLSLLATEYNNCIRLSTGNTQYLNVMALMAYTID